MSVTAEEVRRRLAQGPAVTAEQVRAALRAGGSPGETTPEPLPVDDRSFWERAKQAGAAIAEPVMETVLGIQELQPNYEAMERRKAATRRGLQRVREAASEGPEGTRMAGRVLGEVGLAAVPATKAYKAGAALRGLPGVRSRITRGAVPLATESAAVGGMEALKSPEETGETRAERALETAGLNLAGGVAMGAAKRMALPGMFKKTPLAESEAAALREAGIQPQIPLSAKGVEGTGPFTSFASWMHRRPLGSVPPTQNIIRGQQEAALSDWRDMMFTRAIPEGAEITLPGARTGSLRPVRETFKDVDKWYSDEYRQVLDPYTFDVMGQGSVGDALAQAMSDIPGEATQRQVVDKVSDLLQGYTDRAGRLTGAKVSQLKKSLRNAARLTDDGDVKAGYHQVVEALDDAVEQRIRAVNPEHAQRYTALREPYRNFVTLEEAAKGRKLGDFDPNDLFKASERKLTQEKRPSVRSRGEGPLQWEAERAATVYDFPGRGEESNIFQAQALLGTAAGVAPSFLGPVGSLVSAGLMGPTAAGLTRGGTRFMSDELLWQQALQRAMEREGIQQLGRVMRIGGAQAANE